MTTEGLRFPNGTTVVIAVFLIALPCILPSLTLASEILVLATGALSCTLLLGSVGLLSFGQGLYFGLGAYVSAILIRDFEMSALAATIAASLAGCLLAAAAGLLIVRRQGVYFVMLTLAFAQMGFFLALAFPRLTGGENGFGNVPRTAIAFGQFALSNPLLLYVFLAILSFAAFALVQRIVASPFGSVLNSIRYNESRSEALGYDARRFKLAAVTMAGGIAALAGAMNTLMLNFVPLSAIDVETSERLLIASLIGGVGSPLGALIGASVLSAMSDFLSPIWPRWSMVVALLLIVTVLFLRDGLLGLGGVLRRQGKEMPNG
ncbi:branched-chain amino acid ABC transporter permease [Bradyrhizobium yuanmingense]|uniref:branched-chain amino acid ABC transporter permease n=1 Tax=Bradyrhizobium yuanmingense TaxID=108015 RepID=UPI0023BA3757|nr:branched-chain amino acid ABC transporter permease [Bradyrhizobium yuanmingense]MDF0520137.1 branched-chain amino acid ABC transporter permease [Bradyrhizobium yuanmingense]